MNDRFRGHDAGDGERAEDDAEQNLQDRLLDRPKRGDVGCVEQVLRGKIPGNPG
jgi:hypothetical protein